MIKPTQVKRGVHIALALFSFLVLFHGLADAAPPAKEKKKSSKKAGQTYKMDKPPHRVPMLKKNIKVDGVMDEEVWKKALKLELKYEVSPGENIKALVDTEFYMYTTKTHLIAGWVCHDPNPSAIRAPLTDRDKLWQDDYVGLLLDTFNDRRKRFNFFSNPRGVQADFMEMSTNEIIEWDAIWDSAGKISETGYVVEMSIPFNAIRFQNSKKEQIWSFDLARSYPREVRHGLRLIKFDRNNSCYICQAENLVGFKGIKAGKTLELDPTLAAVYTQERDGFPDGEFVKKDSKVKPGLTARWNFTHNMTLAATINPDFSNVEADAAQLDINTQFALFYDEKRPFFLEDATTFKTPLSIVYTRSLAEPDWGVKITGKEGSHSVGLYSVQDNLTNLLFPTATGTGSTSLPLKSIGTVARYRKEVGKASSIGLLVTDREGSEYFNRVAGFDADVNFSKSDRLLVQVVASQTRYPEQVALDNGQSQDKIKGTAVDVLYTHNSRNLSFHTNFRQISSDFRADLGFITQTGYRQMGGGFNYIWQRSTGSWFNQINAGPSFVYETDDQDNLIYKALQFTVVYAGPAQSSIWLVGDAGKRFYRGSLFDTNNVQANMSVIPSAELSFGVYTVIGDHIDFENVRQSNRILLNPYLTYKLGRHITIDLSHFFEYMKVASDRLYTANVTNFKFSYQFNTRALLSTNLQYIDYNYNVDNYLFTLDPRFKHLFTKVLFSYKINPQTVLFLGYSDDYFGFNNIRLTQSNRTFFLKVGYALVM
ncbi:MAG: carbohydrate binding family 9 domain-containing protein [bacterium]|nr:carbohydrate binding family 9 domain-containing protein [bacterium]